MTLYLIGRVDYEDQFGQRHRCSYARRYALVAPGGPDLVFVTKRGYNDDAEL
jgi:hypothetical protein